MKELLSILICLGLLLGGLGDGWLCISKEGVAYGDHAVVHDCASGQSGEFWIEDSGRTCGECLDVALPEKVEVMTTGDMAPRDVVDAPLLVELLLVYGDSLHVCESSERTNLPVDWPTVSGPLTELSTIVLII